MITWPLSYCHCCHSQNYLSVLMWDRQRACIPPIELSVLYWHYAKLQRCSIGAAVVASSFPISHKRCSCLYSVCAIGRGGWVKGYPQMLHWVKAAIRQGLVFYNDPRPDWDISKWDFPSLDFQKSVIFKVAQNIQVLINDFAHLHWPSTKVDWNDGESLLLLFGPALHAKYF